MMRDLSKAAARGQCSGRRACVGFEIDPDPVAAAPAHAGAVETVARGNFKLEMVRRMGDARTPEAGAQIRQVSDIAFERGACAIAGNAPQQERAPASVAAPLVRFCFGNDHDENGLGLKTFFNLPPAAQQRPDKISRIFNIETRREPSSRARLAFYLIKNSVSAATRNGRDPSGGAQGRPRAA